MVNDLRVMRCAKCGNVYTLEEIDALTKRDEFNGPRAIICIGCGAFHILVCPKLISYKLGFYRTFCKSIVDHRPIYDNSLNRK